MPNQLKLDTFQMNIRIVWFCLISSVKNEDAEIKEPDEKSDGPTIRIHIPSELKATARFNKVRALKRFQNRIAKNVSTWKFLLLIINSFDKDIAFHEINMKLIGIV